VKKIGLRLAAGQYQQQQQLLLRLVWKRQNMDLAVLRCDVQRVDTDTVLH